MAERETEQIEPGTESRNVVDNKSTAEHTPEHKQNKDRAAYSDAIDIDLDEDDGETLGVHLHLFREPRKIHLRSIDFKLNQRPH